MRESRDNFLDPLSTTDNKIDYVFAYTAPVVTVDTN
jgi:hypothetical protein